LDEREGEREREHAARLENKGLKNADKRKKESANITLRARRQPLQFISTQLAIKLALKRTVEKYNFTAENNILLFYNIVL